MSANLARYTSYLLRTLIAVCLIRMLLSVFPWFEGTADDPGMADRLFGTHPGNGFRPDFLFLILASGLCLAALVPLGLRPEKRTDFFLALAEVAAFGGYVYSALHRGLLYFG